MGARITQHHDDKKVPLSKSSILEHVYIYIYRGTLSTNSQVLVPTTCALSRLLVVLTPQLFLCTVMLMQVDVGKYANRYPDDIQKRTSKKKVGFTGSKHYNSLRPLNE